MKNTGIYSKLLLIVLFSVFTSCSSDSSSDTDVPKVPKVEVIPSPQISSLSSSLLIEGEELTINGLNFISNGHQTKLVVNGIATNITPVSNTVINLQLTSNLGLEELEIAIQIEDKISNSLNVFVIPNGWYKINSVNSDLDIIKAFAFDDTEDLVLLIDTRPAANSYNGTVFKVSASANGYSSFERVSISDALFDLEMYDKNIGVTTGSNYIYFTEDAFVSNNTSNKLQIGSDAKISYLDENSATVMNTLGKHAHTNDRGLSFLEEESPRHLSTPTANGYSGDGTVKPIKKASDGYLYEIGIIFDRNPIGNFRNYIQKSTSYNNWIVVDSITPFNSALSAAKFINPNYMLSVNSSNQLIQSLDLAQTWTPIKEEVSEFYMRSETEWYAVSNESIISTNDAGASWNIEFNLPAGSIVNHIQFPSSKIVVSGNDGLLYIKHE